MLSEDCTLCTQRRYDMQEQLDVIDDDWTENSVFVESYD